MAGLLMVFIGLTEEEGAPKFFGMNRAQKPKKKPENNIIELNKLEKDFLKRKEQAKTLEEADEALVVLINQLDSELGKLKKGKADESALQRARELLSMIDERLEEKTSPIKELQRKIKKTAMEEIKPNVELKEEGNKMVEEDELKKQEMSIKKAMEAKLREEEQKRKEEEAFGEAVEGEDFFESEVPEKKTEAPVVEEGYFEPAEPEEESFAEEAEKPAETLEEEKRKAKPKQEKQQAIDIERAESLYKSSVEQLLKAQLDNGAIVPSSSEKNYLYAYPRDHAFSTIALVKAGKFDEAKKALEFALKHQNRKTGCFPQRWDEAGNDAGYKPAQPDATALVLYAFAQYVLKKNNVDFAEKNWDRIEKAIDFLNDKLVSDKNLVFTPSSVHEFPPIEQGYEIWANAVCCAAFRELSKVGEKIKVEYEPLAKENVLKDSLVEYMWNSRLNNFIKAIKIKESSSVVVGPDASVLALPFFEVFSPKDKRIKQTVKLVDEKLWHKSFGGISKFTRVEGIERGGFGASPFFTLLLADYYIKAGDRAKAEKYLNWTINISFKGLLPEHVSTKEDFEAYVSDFSDAGLLNKQLMKLINNARAHKEFKNGVAHITEPFSMAHAAFVIAWNDYKEKFLK